ncbi:MAG TPA: membrane-bound O-acyltransferase family protein [Elusimicrobia bacterium]|nr:membrane-bound O-acyltransferase family protein [Elusimicrobiota bacterium]
MTFTSFSFYLFLPAVWLAFHFSAGRFRWAVLLAASYIFYASFRAPQLLLALGFVTTVSYACALRLGSVKDEAARRRVFRLGAGACLALLAASKYLPRALPAGFASEHPEFLVFVGISYFTFQAVSYLADVYLGVQEPEPHLGYHALALAFFPKLLQGPIERAGSLLTQLRAPYSFDYDRTRSALLLFAFGLFKKMVLADRLAQYANWAYADVPAHTGLSMLLGTYAYALQIYFDFAGYTDMARGAARLFGVNLTENFNSPYQAVSIADFWRRWHISFSRWILDYIFKPLQLAWRDLANAGTALALLVTFLVSGLWHGSSWGYVIWGLLHGLYLASSVYYRPYQKKLHAFLGGEKKPLVKAWRVFVTFNLVSFAWIFFRAATLSDAVGAVRGIFDPMGSLAEARKVGFDKFLSTHILMGLGNWDPAILLFAFAVIYIVRRYRTVNIFEKPAWLRWSVYYALFAMIVFLGMAKDNFVYFKF